MKVLFVSSGTSKEKISILVFNQGESLKNAGIDIDYFTIKSKGFLGYIIHVYKLKKHLKLNKYDILHAHYGLSGLLTVLAKDRNQKMIISYMGTDLLGSRTKQGGHTLLGQLMLRLNLWAARYSDFIIVKSKEMADKVRCKNIAVIPNGVDLTKFFPVEKLLALKETGWCADKVHILFVGDKKRPEKNYQLAKKAVKPLESNGIEMHLLNSKSTEATLYTYNSADVCLLTSFHEGSPNVIKEAMACNRVIVSTRVGDVEDLFGKTTGYFLSSFNTDDLSRQIMKAIKFNESDIQPSGRERIIELELESNKVADRIINIYQEVLGSGTIKTR